MAETLQIWPVPALQDNYVYILQCNETVVAVDPSEAEPVSDFLAEKHWSLNFILNTHHHPDHVGGNGKLKAKFHCPVICSQYDQPRIPTADRSLKNDEQFQLGPLSGVAWSIPGHTLGHMAYYFSASKVIFVGDTLFNSGCGRLFEGTPEQMWQTLTRLKSLPDDVAIYCGHEYTEKNLRFACMVEPENAIAHTMLEKTRQLRSQGLPTVPTTMKIEKQVNPFLRARDLAHFTRLREMRNSF